MSPRRIRVLVVDDSSMVRQFLVSELPKDPAIEVVGTAPDPYIARDRIVELNPDVVTLDIQMPRMNGLSFLKKLMAYHPIPVVILSSQVEPGNAISIEALALGAVDVMAKPASDDPAHLADWLLQLSDAIKGASLVDVLRSRPRLDPRNLSAGPVPRPMRRVEDKAAAREGAAGEAREVREAGEANEANEASEANEARRADTKLGGAPSPRIVALGASTGGPAAIRTLFRELTVECPGIAVVVHMPAGFTLRFARSLNEESPIAVREAVDGDVIRTGMALIAPGDRHLLIARAGGAFSVRVKDGPLVCRHRPSVEVLFRSTAKEAGPHAMGILLTGMGSDGAEGLLSMKQAGAFTVAQDEATSVVYGMPREAVRCGATREVLPLGSIAPCIDRWARGVQRLPG